MKKGMEKKGLQMAVTTVIMIVLSIAVLTILLIFLNSQTGFLSRWFKTQSTQSTVDAVVTVCDNLVTTEAVYAYCCETKDVVLGNKTVLRLTCEDIADEAWALGRVRDLDCVGVTCS